MATWNKRFLKMLLNYAPCYLGQASQTVHYIHNFSFSPGLPPPVVGTAPGRGCTGQVGLGRKTQLFVLFLSRVLFFRYFSK
jgi:hypothetical protein